jgi:hypothetical protein
MIFVITHPPSSLLPLRFGLAGIITERLAR